MREILFRGKNIDSGEWVDGCYFRTLSNDEHIHCIISINNFKKLWGKRFKALGRAVEVDGKTVGQYTGLTDKNGKRIFEGDIVKAFGMIGEIVQECGAFGIQIMPCIDYDLLECEIPYGNNANFCFNDNFISLWELWWNYQQDDEPLEVVEVVGNIHDSPELLKGDKNDPQSGMRQLQN